MKRELPAPDHMDRWTRNERLYRYLRDLGLFVVPVYSDGEYPGIEYLQVATSMPESPLALDPQKNVSGRLKRRLVALPSIVKPVKRL
jgi:hypothetical protein